MTVYMDLDTGLISKEPIEDDGRGHSHSNKFVWLLYDLGQNLDLGYNE